MKARYTTTTSACDLNLEGYDKGTNIQRFLASSRINQGRVLYIGDSDTDINGMRVVRYGGAPANASSNLKDFINRDGIYLTRFISPHEGLDGFDQLYAWYAEGLELVITDVDGVIYERDVTKPEQKGRFRKEKIEGCLGPKSKRPPITICTGRGVKVAKGIIADYGFTKESIPERYHDSWPKLLFENGTILVDPITGKVESLMRAEESESIRKIKIGIEDAIKELQPVYGDEATIDEKDTMVTVRIPKPIRKTQTAIDFTAIVYGIMVRTSEKFGIELTRD